ncbi:siderophore biosynthesis PLP-dependent protein [Bacillus aerolatus]|uniref:Siderophore biosynthesis PLP-dependent protein n=1 Tax=Bacillus aerolatus TaxID=2653354 RepID=A0A6I1FJX1_9BACI|nr:type III PLP-dependent enzyme [Bacillus aerolatus]KAB7706221.1 siderophore biosynthesis PLP-dependent protein [Bacillus aerolatus]
MKKVIEVIERLKEKNDEPVCSYIYDLDHLKKHVESVTRTLPQNCRMYYAMKANSEERILRTVHPYIEGFEVASIGEVKKARAVNQNVPVIFGGPGKTDKELTGAILEDVKLFHVESIHELKRLAMIAEYLNKKVSILLRVNLRGPFPSATLHMAGRPTQFGIDEAQVEEAIQLSLSYQSLQLEGFHFHSISNNLDHERHIELIHIYFQKAKQWSQKYEFPLMYINVGGGIGVNFSDLHQQFNWNHFTGELQQLIDREKMQTVTIIFECGRFLTSSCGYYAVEVIDIKENHGKTFVVICGGTQHFRLPVSWQHNHPFELIPFANWPYPFERKTAANQEVTIVGQLCTPKDVFAKDVSINQLRIGDVIVFHYAGAYGWSISHHDFLSHPHPQHLFLERETALKA